MTKWSKFGLFGVGIAVSIGLAVQLGNWWRGGEEGAAVVLLPDDSALVADGRKLYDQACASCHGAMLEGQPNWRQRKAYGRFPAPPHDPSGHTWHHPDAVLFVLTKQGPAALSRGGTYVSDMPGFADTLSDRDIIAILSYIKSTWPPEIRLRHDEINARARSNPTTS